MMTQQVLYNLSTTCIHPPSPSWRVFVWSTLIALVIGSTGLAQEAPKTSGDDQEADESLPAVLRDPLLSPFSLPTVLQARALRGLTGEAASLALLGTEGGSISIEASAVPLAGTADKAQVPFFVEIDGSTFLQNNQARTARMEVYVYAIDAEKKVAGYLAEVFAVDVHELGEAIWQSGLKFFGHLELAPGTYELRVLVRNFQSKANALRLSKIEVPRVEPGEVVLLSPVFPGPAARDPWLPVREWSLEPLNDYPFIVGKQVVSPASLPVLVVGRNETAYLFGYNLPPGLEGGQIEWLRGEDVVERTALTLPESSTSRALGARTIPFDVPTLTPGTYALRFRFDLKGRQLISPSTRVVVLELATQERTLLWTDLRGLMNAEATVAADAPSALAGTKTNRRGRKKRLRQLAEGYRQAVDAANQGDGAATLSPLVDFESGALTGGLGNQLEVLRAAELMVAESLAEQDVECLVPILRLHEALYLAYRQRHLFSLAAHARDVVSLIADLYAKKGQSEGSRIVAARALVSLAGLLQDANLPTSSRALFLRALEHDPRSQAALIGLAVSFERYGDRQQTIFFLESLVEEYPNFGEGLVRLAINLQRVGLRARALELLNRAIALNGPGWVRALAFQEIARQYMHTGQYQRMVELLERAVAEIPDQKSSWVLLAHAYDRMQLPSKAIALATDIGADARQQDSARKRYDSWPETAFLSVREALDGAANSRRQALQLLIGVESKP